MSKKIISLVAVSVVVLVGAFALQPSHALAASTVYVSQLLPDWSTGVYSAYYGPTAYDPTSPGQVTLYDGREAGIIKAGLNIDSDGHYEDEGLFAFQPNVTINELAADPLTYDVANQYGENPVWMTIEIDTGVVGSRADNTVYQFVPTTNPSGWHTVDAGAGMWQKWNNSDGDTTGNPLVTMSDLATEYSGFNVVRVYLRLGIGDSYHGIAGMGTVGWVDKAIMGGTTYDFVLPSTTNTEILYLTDTLGSNDGQSALYRVELNNATTQADLTPVIYNNGTGIFPLNHLDAIAASPNGSIIYLIDDGPISTHTISEYNTIIGTLSSPVPVTGVSTASGNRIDQAATAPDGTLYVADDNTNSLYTLDPTTGVATLVGVIRNGSVTVDVQGADIVFAQDGTLYLWTDNAVSGAPMGLYVLALPAVGGVVNATYEGPSTSVPSFTGLAIRQNGVGDLVGSQTTNDSIVVVNKSTGAISTSYPMYENGNRYSYAYGDMTAGPIIPTGSVSGTKYDDVTANGKTSDDTVIPGWTIKLYDTATTPWTLIDTQVTDSNGEYAFNNLPFADYKVCEVQQSGWINTFSTYSVSPNPDNANELCQTVNIDTNGETNTRNFGNYQIAPLEVSKTANTSYDRTYTWTIDKSADTNSLTLAPGETYDVGYNVKVDETNEDSNWGAEGDINIHNPNAIDATINSVSDVMTGSINAPVDCGVTFPYTLSAKGDLTCTYSTDLPDATSRTNTATVTTGGDVPGNTATTSVTFGDPSTTTDACIDVNDTYAGSLGTVCANTDTLPKTFNYDRTVGPYDYPGTYQATNIASFVTNDTKTTGDSSWTVNVNVPETGCTLTQGYWKTHSSYGPAPFDSTWNLVGGAASIFASSSQSYYDVLWTAPKKGNAYYQLAHQYIAAELNVKNGASVTADVQTALTEAASLLSSYTPDDIAALKGNSPLRKEFIYDAGILGNYNEGLSGPGHCDEQTPTLVDTVTVNSADMSGADSNITLASGKIYMFVATGTWVNGLTRYVDAEYISDDNWATYQDGPALGPNQLDLQVNDTFVNWGAYSPIHIYESDYAGTGSDVNFRVFDGDANTNTPNSSWYGDNNGNLTVSIYEL